MNSLEPHDFGGIYHAIWDEMIEGNMDACCSLIKTLQVLAHSESEADQLGAKATLRELSQQLHQHIRTQDLMQFENLERHQYEQLLTMLEESEWEEGKGML